MGRKKGKRRKTKLAPVIMVKSSPKRKLSNINKMMSGVKIRRGSPYTLRSQVEMNNAFRKVQARGRFNNKKHGAGRVLGSISRRNTFAERISKAMIGGVMATQEVGYRHRGTFQPSSYKPTPHKWRI